MRDVLPGCIIHITIGGGDTNEALGLPRLPQCHPQATLDGTVAWVRMRETTVCPVGHVDPFLGAPGNYKGNTQGDTPVQGKDRTTVLYYILILVPCVQYADRGEVSPMGIVLTYPAQSTTLG